jgi:hypothetical protein
MAGERQKTDESDVADGSSYREDARPGGSETADGSNYRDEQEDHPLHEDRVDPDGVIERAEEEERKRTGHGDRP